MNGTVLDILIYVFDRYMFDEAPEVPEREALARDLESAGFGEANVERALDWLADLAGERHRPGGAAPPMAMRHASRAPRCASTPPMELTRLSVDCRGLLLSAGKGRHPDARRSAKSSSTACWRWTWKT